MHPYRTAPPGNDDGDPQREEWLVAGALTLLGGVRVVLAMIGEEVFGTEVTIAAILGCVGCVFGAQLAVRAWREARSTPACRRVSKVHQRS